MPHVNINKALQNDNVCLCEVVCECGAHFLLEEYTVRHCPKCAEQWVINEQGVPLAVTGGIQSPNE